MYIRFTGRSVPGVHKCGMWSAKRMLQRSVKWVALQRAGAVHLPEPVCDPAAERQDLVSIQDHDTGQQFRRMAS